MPGNEKTPAPLPSPLPTTFEELAALMTKLLGSLEARMEAHLTSLESRFAAAFPSFTAPSPVPPQQHGEGIFYGGVDGTQAAAPPLPVAARCWHPVVPAAVALPHLGKKKAFAWEDVCHVFAAVRLQAAARGLLARRRLQKMRLEMQEAALTAIDLGNWGATSANGGATLSRRKATSARANSPLSSSAR